MTNKNLPKYIQENWEHHKVTVTVASRNQSGKPLVKSDRTVYNFDTLCDTLFSGRDNPCSADGIQVHGRNVDLIEFKSGFRQVITKKSFDRSKCLCPKFDPPVYCSDYGDLLLKHQDKITAELIDSIKLKAVESYILLEKHFIPLCEEIDGARKVNINYVVVVDADGDDGIEDTLAELAGTEPDTDNKLIAIRSSLKRFLNRQDANGNSYLYDSIEVLSASDFACRIERA